MSQVALGSFRNLEEAGQAVTTYLRRHMGVASVAVTRKTPDHQVVLQSSGEMAPGDFLMWEDSVCSRMLAGEGPHVAPDVEKVPAYASARARREIEIGAYAGFPIYDPDGSVFGVLCAIDPQAQDSAFEEHGPLLELMSGLLSTILVHEMDAAAHSDRADRAHTDANTDALTGIPNRRAWEARLADQDDICRTLGEPATILYIDLDGFKTTNDTLGHEAGDGLLKEVARVLRSCLRDSDFVARIGGDEFAILAPHCATADARMLQGRVWDAIHDAGIRASIGVATHQPGTGLADTFAEADVSMFEHKSIRQALAETFEHLKNDAE